MSADEIHRQLLLIKATHAEVQTQLDTTPWLLRKINFKAVKSGKKLYYLKDRSDLIAHRQRQEGATDALIAQHTTVLHLLTMMPYVRMVAFSGGTSRKNSIQDEDLDLFIIAEKDRAWTVYAMMIALARSLGCREVLCANYLVDRVHITVPDGGDLFTGQELMALRPLIGEDWLKEMVQRNGWVEGLLPNATPQRPLQLWQTLGFEPTLRRGLELGLWPQWWLVERTSRAFFGRRIRQKARREANADVLLRPGILKLHTSDNRGEIVTRYREALLRFDVLEAGIERALGKRLRRDKNGDAVGDTAGNAAGGTP